TSSRSMWNSSAIPLGSGWMLAYQSSVPDSAGYQSLRSRMGASINVIAFAGKATDATFSLLTGEPAGSSNAAHARRRSSIASVGATPAPGAMPRSTSIGTPPGTARNHRRQPPSPEALGLSSMNAYPALDPVSAVIAPSGCWPAKTRSGSAPPGTNRQISDGRASSPPTQTTSLPMLIG